MWIGDKNKKLLVDRVFDGLSDPESGTSYSLTIPPGFGESYVPREIARRLRSSSKAKVAHIEIDMLGKDCSFVRELFRQWNGEGEIPESLSEVISRLANEGDSNVIIISRFHKFLDLDVADEALLRTLREAEQAKDIRTVVASIYPLKWIEAEWKRQGNKLLGSGFGDMHAPRHSQPIDAGEFFQAFSNYRNAAVPPTVIKKVLAWTGGVPQHFKDVLDLWVDCEAPDLESEETQFRQLSCDRAESLAKYLDADGSKYLDLIVDIHMRQFVEDAIRKFNVHPWSDLILDESGLRSDSLGEQCLNRKVKSAVDESLGEDPHSTQLELAEKAYRSGHFDYALRCLSAVSDSGCTGENRLLIHHVRIMDSLLSRGIDAEWKSLKDALCAAEQHLEEFGLSQKDVQRLKQKYGELRQISETVAGSLGRGSTRVVDQLSVGDSKERQAALAILVLQYEDAKSSRGNSESISKAVAMPEQLLRVWAGWHLGIDYSKVPEDNSEAWELAKSQWKLIRGDELLVPAPGEKFPGFAVFAFFCVSKQSLEEGRNPLIEDFEELNTIQFAFDLRNAPAHATTMFNGKSRRKYLDLIERWLVRLCEGYPDGRLTYREVLSWVALLPLAKNSSLSW